MDTVILTSQAAFVALKPQWDQLYQRAASASPFGSFHWIKLWMEHLAPRSRLQQDTWHIITMWRHGELIGAAPMILTTYRMIGLPVLRYLRPIGSDHNVTEIKAPLIEPTCEAQVVPAMIHHFLEIESSYDLIRWPDLPAKNLGIFAECWTAIVDSYIVRTDLPWQHFLAKQKRNLKEAIRKAYNAPARDGVDLSFAVIDDRQELGVRLPELFRLHALRARALSGPRHPDYFAAPSAQNFIQTFVQASDTVRPLLFELRHGSSTVAARLGFVSGDTLYFYFSGYDFDYGCYSVMTRLVAEAMQYAILSGITRINLSTGSDQSKLRWDPQRIDYRTGQTWSRRGRGRIYSKIFALANGQGRLIPALKDARPGPPEVLAGQLAQLANASSPLSELASH